MSGGSAEPEHPTDVQCDHCGLYWASSGIDTHEAHCDGTAEAKDPRPQPAGQQAGRTRGQGQAQPQGSPGGQPSRQPQPQPPQQPQGQPPQQPESSTDPMVGDAGAGEEGSAPTCPNCDGRLEDPPAYVEGQNRGLLQTTGDDGVCASCGLLVEGDGTTEELVPQ